MRQKLLPVFGLALLLTAACGTFAEPPPNSATLEALRAESDVEVVDSSDGVVAILPTTTPLPPTATPLPATETPTPPPATEEPEEEPAEEIPAGEPLTAEEENLIFFIQEFSDAGNGRQLFNATYSVEMAGGTLGDWACSTCHLISNDDGGVGPGMYSLALRAGERVPGQPAELYIYESIIHPNAYIVEGYVENIMPVGYEDIFTEQQLYDISAYLMTLTGDN